MYTIDLNDPEKLTMRNVQKMLASRDDSEHAQIRVSHGGRAYIEYVRWGVDRIEGVLFRSGTFAAGTGYVGLGAAKDPAWVQEVYEDLRKLRKACEYLKTNWPKPTKLRSGAQRPYSLYPPMVWGYYGPYANWTKLADNYEGEKFYIEYPVENGLRACLVRFTLTSPAAAVSGGS